jgi:hypothetical protein
MDTTDVGVLTEDDQACFDELGQYLVSADAWQQFAIWLLHKHFEPAPGELFVECALTATRKTETSPIERSAFGTLNATAMRFDGTVSSGVGLIGMEYAEPADFGPTSPLSADDEAVLVGIAERLAVHGKTERFGVRMINDALAMSEDELLLETSDSAQRTLQCVVAQRDSIAARNNVETTWRWKPVEGETGRTVMQQCFSSCEVGPPTCHFFAAALR